MMGTDMMGGGMGLWMILNIFLWVLIIAGIIIIIIWAVSKSRGPEEKQGKSRPWTSSRNVTPEAR